MALPGPGTAQAWAAGATPMTMSLAEFDAFLREDITKWARGGQHLPGAKARPVTSRQALSS